MSEVNECTKVSWSIVDIMFMDDGKPYDKSRKDPYATKNHWYSNTARWVPAEYQDRKGVICNGLASSKMT